MRTAHEALSRAHELAEAGLLANEDPDRVAAALGKAQPGDEDLALLLSPGAREQLEAMAQRSRRTTLERFGRTVVLYAPLYLSNRCQGRCPYCGFRADRDLPRRALSPDEVAAEARRLQEQGLLHVLLVAGDDPALTPASLAAFVRRVRELVPVVTVEVPALDEAGYVALREAGVDGSTLYQETYDAALYGGLHPSGPKADFDARLTAADRAAAAGLRTLTVGFLGGLGPWRFEALAVGLHARYLQRRWWRSLVSVGFPRLHEVPAGFEVEHPLDDAGLVQAVAALRLFLPDAGLVLSTREAPALRDRLALLGVTQMSAGSRTEPGGYTCPDEDAVQFPVSDHRSPAEVAAALAAQGYDAVRKDWG